MMLALFTMQSKGLAVKVAVMPASVSYIVDNSDGTSVIYMNADNEYIEVNESFDVVVERMRRSMEDS